MARMVDFATHLYKLFSVDRRAALKRGSAPRPAREPLWSPDNGGQLSFEHVAALGQALNGMSTGALT
jgi:hypothetical protein